MVIPKSTDKPPPQSDEVETLSFLQLSKSLNHFSSNGNATLAESRLQFKSRGFSETDPLINNELYGGCRPDRAMETKDEESSVAPAESTCAMVLQILGPFLLAGLGTVSAGMLLDAIQNWDVFLHVTELYILVPAVLGMKGNLEMTLASRLSTAVNAGRMETSREKWMLIVGNLALKQLQATILGLLASMLATVLGWMTKGKMPFNHMILLWTAGVSTAFVASLLQGVVMVGIIMKSKKMGVNPDNVATPMAASFGDLITLSLLAGFGHWFYSIADLYPYVLYLVNLLAICLIPVWVKLSSKHPASQVLLRSGWEPIVTAMIISSVGGLILDTTMSDHNLTAILLYAPVVNGVGGNLVSIQSSRISTHLHLHYSPGALPEGRRSCVNPWRIFFGSGPNARSALVLLLLVLPCQLAFLYMIYLMKGGITFPSPLLIIFYLAASFLQVFSLLCLADWIVHCLWWRGKDPDSYSIPYLTAIGDLLGTALTSLAVFILWRIGEKSKV